METHNTSSESSTMVMELSPYPSGETSTLKPVVALVHSKKIASSGTMEQKLSSEPSVEITLPIGPKTVRWNQSPITVLRLLATFYSFLVAGFNDGAYGALIPYLEPYYNINYTIVSLIFLCPIVGYTVSAFTNNTIHVKMGQRGMAIFMSLSHALAFVLACVHPPFPVVVIAYIFAGYANGLGDSGWNAWIGDMANSNELLGLLHGCYGLGASVSPLIATALITKAGWKWYQYYYLLIGAGVLECIFSIGVFWTATGAVYRADHRHDSGDDDSISETPTSARTSRLTTQDTILEARPHRTPWYIRINPFQNTNSLTVMALKNKVTLVMSAFLLVYVGVEMSLGGWVVSFMLDVRKASPFASGLTSTGYWFGLTLGRSLLGFVTPRLFPTEKHAVATYLAICIVLQLLLWLIKYFVVSAIMVGLLGFFLGPLFPAGVVVLAKLLPKRLHVAGIGFAAAFGVSGGCVMPFIIGAIANVKGVWVLQPILCAFLAVALGIWFFIPDIPKQRKE